MNPVIYMTPEVKARLDAYRRSRLLPSGRGRLTYGEAVAELLDAAGAPTAEPTRAAVEEDLG